MVLRLLAHTGDLPRPPTADDGGQDRQAGRDRERGAAARPACGCACLLTRREAGGGLITGR
jgi:hypothetical protein